MKKNFQLFANYNQWMNRNIYGAASSLSLLQLTEDRGAYFGSVLGTLNHILVGDIIWLKRFATHPTSFASLAYILKLNTPKALSEPIYSNFSELTKAREKMDEVIVAFSLEVTDEDYEHCLAYTNTKGIEFTDNFSSLVQHFYNHQTHHRGQVTTLLNQMGVDCGVTDMLVKIRES